MKTSILLLTLVGTLSFLGCNTTQNGSSSSFDPNKTKLTLRLAINTAGSFALKANDKAYPYLKSVSLLLSDLYEAGQYEPDEILNSLDQIVTTSSTAKSAIVSAIKLYRVWFSEYVNSSIQSNQIVKSVFSGLVDGLSDLVTSFENNNGIKYERLVSPEGEQLEILLYRSGGSGFKSMAREHFNAYSS